MVAVNVALKKKQEEEELAIQEKLRKEKEEAKFQDQIKMLEAGTLVTKIPRMGNPKNTKGSFVYRL